MPADAKTKEGQPVWSGAKRPPTPLIFDAANETHAEFIFAAANLYAVVFGLDPKVAFAHLPTPAAAARFAATVEVPEWRPKVVTYATSDEDAKAAGGVAAAAPQPGDAPMSVDQLPPIEPLQSLQLRPQEFEKDDDTNFHLDFMHAVSNLRAVSYGIPTCTRHHTKLIAGRIIPAMITTTAATTGLVMMEVLKYMLGAKKLEHYRNSFMNIALPFLAVEIPWKPAAASSYKTRDGREIVFTAWDRVDVGGDGSGGDMTLQAVLDDLKQRFDLDVDMITTAAGRFVYNAMTVKPERLKMPITKILETVGTPVGPEDETLTLVLTATCNEEDVEVPTLNYRFKKHVRH
jgi:ubiquitin-activating enzyme E1